MAKKKDSPKPIYPLAHEFQDSLQNVLHAAGMLMTVVETVLEHPEAFERLRDKLKENATELHAAMYQD